MPAPAHLYAGVQRVIAPVLEGAHRETHPLADPIHADPGRCDICNP